MEIYLDLLFLMNFIMDLLLICAVSDVLSIVIKLWRAAASAVLGAMLGVCFFAADLHFVSSLAASLSAGALMIFAAMGRCCPKEFLKRLGMLYLISAIFAGVSFFDMTMFGGGMIKNGVFYSSSPRIIIGAAAIYFVLRFVITRLKRRAASEYCSVALEFKGKTVRTRAMTDTGNGLRDPISKKPVMLVESDILKKLAGGECSVGNLREWVEKERIRVIPYETIDSEGVLTGIVLDRAVINGREIKNAVAAVSTKSLKYPVILHAGM